ncbi:LCP family protein [Pseudalkalibacillus hwajinpoensis]|uniref:LytR family transcriptional regulator n=1 Tax=Guptibacillus hwajinpoensis TaxID=208199 RepID=A0A4U1MI21_9BACL|nr:LCP family protein [Pseudalkalibacillus hwajinpoensis]TKD69980.1 LytR family transcriptional regulator [Pseudalkalibacillus hwajinpoensis]
MSNRIKNRRRKKLKRKVRIGLSVFLLFLISVGAYLFFSVYDTAKQSFNELDRENDMSELRDTRVDIGKDPISILLLGIENYTSNGKGGRADTQIVLTLDPKSKNVTMTSIPRDTKVEMSGDKVNTEYAGSHKINAAYTYGYLSQYGANKLAVETVEDLLEIPIDRYVAVDFDGFHDIVEAIGGVKVDVKYPFWEKNYYSNDRIYFDEGVTKMNGEEALAFVRMRKRDVNTVYSREERQKQFIKATVDEVKSGDTIFEINKISDVLKDNVETNLKPGEILALQRKFKSMGSTSIETKEIKGTTPEVDGPSYFIPDLEQLDILKRELKDSLNLL